MCYFSRKRRCMLGAASISAISPPIKYLTALHGRTCILLCISISCTCNQRIKSRYERCQKHATARPLYISPNCKMVSRAHVLPGNVRSTSYCQRLPSGA